MNNMTHPYKLSNSAAIQLFSDYLRITGVAHIDPEPGGPPELAGKRLGLLNGSSWITLWSNFFGRLYLPGVHLVNAGNEAVQINFMHAYEAGMPIPPQSNIDAFVNYAYDLVNLSQVDAVIITCSTMNRAYPQIQSALRPFGVPVVQIDQPMMECAVKHQGQVLVIATHGPTIENTHALLRETAEAQGQEISFSGVCVEDAWSRLAIGDVEGHNQLIVETLRFHLRQNEYSCVVLAQLSMTVFLLSFPDPLTSFGLPILSSGQCGFEHVRGLLTQ